MRIIKLGLISIGILLLLLFGISALMPDQIQIIRTVTMNTEPDKTGTYLQDLSTWKDWNVMVVDSTVRDPIFEPDRIRSGNYEVKKISVSPGQVITHWSNHKKTISSIMNYVADEQDGTTVQWIFDIELGWYPWDKFASMIFDKQLGMPMERSLGNLEKILNQPS